MQHLHISQFCQLYQPAKQFHQKRDFTAQPVGCPYPAYTSCWVPLPSLYIMLVCPWYRQTPCNRQSGAIVQQRSLFINTPQVNNGLQFHLLNSRCLSFIRGTPRLGMAPKHATQVSVLIVRGAQSRGLCQSRGHCYQMSGVINAPTLLQWNGLMPS